MIAAWFRRVWTWRTRKAQAAASSERAAYWTRMESDYREEADELMARADALPLCHRDREWLATRSRQADCLAQAAHYRAGGDETSAAIWDAMAIEYARQITRAAWERENANA